MDNEVRWAGAENSGRVERDQDDRNEELHLLHRNPIYPSGCLDVCDRLIPRRGALKYGLLRLSRSAVCQSPRMCELMEPRNFKSLNKPTFFTCLCKRVISVLEMCQYDCGRPIFERGNVEVLYIDVEASCYCDRCTYSDLSKTGQWVT